MVKRREIVSTRLPKPMIKSLNEIAKESGADRTAVMEEFLEIGIKKHGQKKRAKFFSYSMMSIALTWFGMWVSTYYAYL